jgi:hypothetical protein
MTLPAPAIPGLAPVFTITANIAAPLDAGPGLGGRRLHIPITGGRVDGPRLTGEVLPGGSDWALMRDDGLTEVQASYTIRATDGTPVWVQNHGLRRCPADVLARLRAGEAVDPADYWFRAAPRFDAPDGPHAWLRETLFVASLAPRGRTIVIDVFDVT